MLWRLRDSQEPGCRKTPTLSPSFVGDLSEYFFHPESFIRRKSGKNQEDGPGLSLHHIIHRCSAAIADARLTRDKHDTKFKAQGLKFRKPRASDLEPSSVTRVSRTPPYHHTPSGTMLANDLRWTGGYGSIPWMSLSKTIARLYG
jgi:hypothetical protein